MISNMAYRRKDDKREERATPLKEAFNKLLHSYEIKDKYEANKLVLSWKELMGPTIANRTEKIYLLDHTLHIKLSSPHLRQEMMMSKQRVLDIIVEKFGNDLVKDIRFY